MIDLQQQIETLKRYLLDRYALEDWHGVRDAAVDIEVLTARMSPLMWEDHKHLWFMCPSDKSKDICGRIGCNVWRSHVEGTI
jgi:hypothetical protein